MNGGAETTREDRERALEGAARIVFLCSGNMVRSAFAELFARHVGFPRPVASAATIFRNDRIHPETARALAARGVDGAWMRAFHPTHVDELLPRLESGAVLLGMRYHHIEALDGAWRSRAFLLDEGREIADPVLEGADFGATFDVLERAVTALAARLRS